MKEINKCPNCGAGITYNEDKTEAKCLYCNSKFELDKANPQPQTANIKDLQVEYEEVKTKRPRVNIFILWVLFMTFPPFAIFYLVSQIIKQKNWDDKYRH